MKSFEIAGLNRLKIKPVKWGTSYRVKVRSQSGRLTYISNVSKPSHQKLIAKFYKTDLEVLKANLKQVRDIKATSAQLETQEWYLYENLSEADVFPMIRTELAKQTKAFKVNIQLGYDLIDQNGDVFSFYPSSLTEVFSKPVSINQKSDIESKVMSYIESKDFAETIRNYNNSSTKLKEITMLKVLIYYRGHVLGANIDLPDCIKTNQHVYDIENSDGKCMFFCIAYHLQEGNKKRRVIKPAKRIVEQYCEYKGIEYSNNVFKNFKSVDILQFDELEDCFKLNIDVFEMDINTLEVKKIRSSETGYDNTINILDFNGHAMYITNIDMFLSKYCCTKCEMVFASCDKLRNHKKNKCQIETIESFVKDPRVYRPKDNSVKQALSRYEIKNLDHYLDHYIVYDFEAILQTIDHQSGANTRYTSRHVPVSVSVCDSLTKQVRCFVSDKPRELLEQMFEYVETIALKIREANFKKFQPLIEKIMKTTPFIGDIIGCSVVSHFSYEDIMKMIDDGKWSSLFDFYDNALMPEYKGLKQIRSSFDQTPLIGFNSGRYDINLIKNELFSVLGANSIKMVIKNPSYMCISTHTLKMLDISNYLPAGTSYSNYLETYLGKCKCSDKIQCVCGLGKGLFPYEYITTFDKLNETSLPSKSAFDSKLKNTSISDDDYERVKWVWNHYQMTSIKDFLIWYNNLDVVPFVDAIAKHRTMFKQFDLDMFIDGVSLPSLAEKVMYRSTYKNLIEPKKQYGAGFTFPLSRFNGYKKQDEEADREYGLTIDHLNYLLKKQFYSCTYCKCALTADNASADRKNNSKGHIDGNIIMSCIECNCAKSDKSEASFRYKKLIEFNAHRLVFSIDEEQKDIYHKMKANIAGGPSIIFNRYAKRNETTIRGGKLVKKVIGYDANALYLWALGNEMPCGRLTTEEAYDGIIDDIRNNGKFGFLECDIETPEHLKEYFSEMTPIFKNIEVNPDDESVVGSHMYAYNQAKGRSRAKKSKKLIGSYFGEKILVYTPLLKWYLDHGMVITKTYSFIKADNHKPFNGFMSEVSNARREGDVNPDKAMIADMMKLIGNSAFGRSGMDKSKHKNVKYESSTANVKGIVERNNFHDVEELDGAFEVSMYKRSIKLNNPIHLSIAIYQLAKLRMLQFYYDCLDKYFDRFDFQYQEMDTDSAYVAFSDEHPFPNLIRPELKDHFEANKSEWFPRDDNEEHAKFDKRTPGLFKEEWRGNGIISLSPKNYICFDPDEGNKQKCSAKGVQQSGGKNSDILNPDSFESVVKERITLNATNNGFRIDKQSKSIITYKQTKIGLNYMYDKRQVLSDGISTIPLNI